VEDSLAKNRTGALQVNERSTPINGYRLTLIHSKNTTTSASCVAQAKTQERRGEKKSEKNEQKRKEEKHQLTFQPTSTATSPSPSPFPSPKANSSFESPHVSPSKPGSPSPPNCSWIIQLQQVQTAYHAHLKASVLRCLNLLSLKCSS